MLTLQLFIFISYIPSAQFMYVVYAACAAFFLTEIAGKMRKKLGMAPGNTCNDWCESCCCVPCKIIQIGLELEDIENPAVKELVFEYSKRTTL